MFQLPPVTVQPIGLIRSPRTTLEDDYWGGLEALIELDPGWFGPEALLGIEEFSHLEVLFWMHRVEESQIERGARHPRNNRAWPRVGIFAQRAKARPNRLGLSRCALKGRDGLVLRVEGLDALDGTPVLDLKPWLAEMGPRGPIRQPAWSHELMASYY